MREYFIGFALHPEEEDTGTCDMELPPLPLLTFCLYIYFQFSYEYVREHI